MIGGEHFLTVSPKVKDSLASRLSTQTKNSTGDLALFATGRDALFTIADSIPQRTIALPDLICRSVYDACCAAGKNVEFYNADPLSSNATACGAISGPDKSILVMHYFGQADTDAITSARKCGASVISDGTHITLDSKAMKDVAEASDFVFGSLRKLVGIPDGAFVAGATRQVPQVDRGLREDVYVLRAAALLSRGFSVSNQFENDENFELFQKAEAMLDSTGAGSFGCSYLSRRLLERFDAVHMAEVAIQNTKVLNKKLGGYVRTASNAESVSPYFFVCFDSQVQRDKVRSSLASRKMYCPVHWATDWSPSPSHFSDVGLSIPCDFRYSQEQMNTLSDFLLSCLNA